jgi:hypothetical protein
VSSWEVDVSAYFKYSLSDSVFIESLTIEIGLNEGSKVRCMCFVITDRRQMRRMEFELERRSSWDRPPGWSVISVATIRHIGVLVYFLRFHERHGLSPLVFNTLNVDLMTCDDLDCPPL